MLKVDRLVGGYGDITVLHGVTLEVGAGETVALVGSNGAGKTTLLRTIAGLMTPNAGAITFGDADVTSHRPHRRVGSGLVLVPEGRRLFAGLTVEQNLELGAYRRSDRSSIALDLKRVYDTFPVLGGRRAQPAGSLSGGEQQMCAIGRGLMAAPKLLMIDELSLGLSPVAVDGLLDAIEKLREQGITILLVEQDVQVALRTADRGYVLESGAVVLEGSAAELLEHPRLRSAYLGL